jgi:pimeloyl-ACP methyl ester carboxylesterase
LYFSGIQGPAFSLLAMEIEFCTANGITLHALKYGGNGPDLLLLHGLTANAFAFEGLINNGLTDYANVFSVDLRGRGLSDAPETGYTMEESAKDILGVMDHIGIAHCILAGHSYGAFLSWYMAAHYPERVEAVIAMDAAMRMNPRTLEMLGPSLSRLGQVYKDVDTYLQGVKQAPYLHFWDDDMLSYYHGDLKTLEDGSVMPRPNPVQMAEAAKQVLAEPWFEILQKVKQPVLMVHAKENYTFGEPLLPEAFAKETAAVFTDIDFVQVPGNHQTMLYGAGASKTVDFIRDFLQKLKSKQAT